MAWHEEAGKAKLHFLFKLRLSKNVGRALAHIRWPMWEGQPTVGIEQIAETVVQLDGWSQHRRVVFIRTMKPAYLRPTSLPAKTASPGQLVMLYRKRADAENVFDELKNQRDFTGFCSHKAVVSETAARLLLLTYNLWTLFVGVVKEQGVHTEAVTSRNEMLLIPAKLLERGGQLSRKPTSGSNDG